MSDSNLTSQQEKFCQEIAKGKSQSDAYRIAYPKSKKWKENAIHVAGSKLMTVGKVLVRVAELAEKSADIAVLNSADILSQVRKLATSDIANIMHPDGRVKLPNELDPETRAAVASFEIDEYGRIKYKFWDKNAAIDKAMKHLGLFEVDNKQKTDPLSDLLKGLSGNILGPKRGVSLFVNKEEDDEDD